jgi:hypothetical protein
MMRKANASDIAPLTSLEQLRHTPAHSANASHIMTPDELDAAITEAERRVAVSHPNAQSQLQKLCVEQKRRNLDSEEDRLLRLRRRLAWELKKERQEIGKQKRLIDCLIL